jgi:hypothetical protein
VLIHPWDAALDDDEWRSWLADGHDFGQLIVNGLPGQPPAVIPTHFTVEDTPAGTVLLVHLARPNPVWTNIEADRHVVVTVVDDYAYVPTTWRAKAGGPDEDGVPTSYYTAVQLRCRLDVLLGQVGAVLRRTAHPHRLRDRPHRGPRRAGVLGHRAERHRVLLDRGRGQPPARPDQCRLGRHAPARHQGRIEPLPTRAITYRITVDDLAGIQLTGSGSVTAAGITTPALSNDISDSGDITIDGSAPASRRSMPASWSPINASGGPRGPRRCRAPLGR